MTNYLDDINILLSRGVASILYLLGLAYAMSNKTTGRSFTIKIFSIGFAEGFGVRRLDGALSFYNNEMQQFY